jgi:hypothetical protein
MTEPPELLGYVESPPSRERVDPEEPLDVPTLTTISPALKLASPVLNVREPEFPAVAAPDPTTTSPLPEPELDGAEDNCIDPEETGLVPLLMITRPG